MGVELVKEKAKKMMEKEQERVNKQKGIYDNAEGVAEHIEVKAKKQAKLSQMVTATFQKTPVLEMAKKEQTEKAEEKAKLAASKAKEMKEKAAEEDSEAKDEKAKAKQASNSDLDRALARRKDAKEELAAAEQAVKDAKSKPVSAASTELRSSNQLQHQSRRSQDEAALFNAKTKHDAEVAKKQLHADGYAQSGTSR